MASALWLLLTLALLLQVSFLFEAAHAERLGDKECQEYGFNSALLKCSTCEHVQRVLGENTDAAKKCAACCASDKTVEEKFEKAVLEVDKRSLAYLPDLSAIVKMKKELNLKVKFDHVNPRLLMYKGSEDNEAADTIPVHSWTTDTFKEYLKAHLLPSKAKPKKSGTSDEEL